MLAVQEMQKMCCGLRRSFGKGNDNPLQYSCLGNPMDRRSLADFSPWDHKESDVILQLSNCVRLCSKKKKILKNEANKLIYKTKIDSQTENRLMVTKGEREREGQIRS